MAKLVAVPAMSAKRPKSDMLNASEDFEKRHFLTSPSEKPDVTSSGPTDGPLRSPLAGHGTWSIARDRPRSAHKSFRRLFRRVSVASIAVNEDQYRRPLHEEHHLARAPAETR